jgi:hypothetical protein
MKSIVMDFEVIFATSPSNRIRMSSPRKSLSIPHVLPMTYSKLDMDLVYSTSLVSSFLSLFRKSAARKITTIACAIFRRYRFISGTEAGEEIIDHCSSPIGENNPRLRKANITSAPIEKSLKNQLLLNVFASYRATVLIL